MNSRDYDYDENNQPANHGPRRTRIALVGRRRKVDHVSPVLAVYSQNVISETDDAPVFEDVWILPFVMNVAIRNAIVVNVDVVDDNAASTQRQAHFLQRGARIFLFLEK